MRFDEEASKTFNQLMKEFPDSSYAKDAVTMLELLKIAHN